MGDVHSDQKNYDKAIECYNKAIKLDKEFAYPWIGLGYIYTDQKNYDKAIECYNKAIELDNKDALPWNGLGDVHSDQKNYDKAIGCYNKSIELDNKDAYPWNKLGNILRIQGNYNKAIECYNKAIELNSEYALPWNGLGLVYKSLENYDKAIEYFLKFSEIDPNEKGMYYNYGTVLELKGEDNLALDKYKIAKAFFEKEKNEYWLSAVNKKIELLTEKIKSGKILNKKKEQEKFGAIGEILNETIKRGIEKNAIESKKSFFNFLKETTKTKEEKETFHVLRRWNSYTPIIADNYHISKGGGYFLKSNNKGIVIDPGFNFIDNFRGAGHFFDSIDTVIVSHAHNDHTSDLESILTLLYKFNQEIKDSSDPNNENTIRKVIAERKRIDPLNISDDEIEKEFIKSSRRKIINFYITLSVFKKFSGLFDLFSKNDYRLHIIQSGDKIKIEAGLDLEIIKAKHYDVISDRNAVGIIIKLDKCCVIYTGDSGWDKEIEEEYKQVAKNYKKDYKLLLAHIGGLKEYERNYLTRKDKSRAYYKNHLGRLGLAKLVEILKPNVCFISEFGEELKEYREELSEIFQKAFKDKVIFLPADIGLIFDLSNKKIQAICSCNASKNEISYDYVEPSKVKTCLLRKDYSIHYYSTDKRIVDKDLVQVLSEHFDVSKK